MGDRLEHPEARISFPVLHSIHVRLVTAHPVGHMLVGPLAFYSQLRNDGAQRAFGGVAFAFQGCDGTAHIRIIDD